MVQSLISYDFSRDVPGCQVSELRLSKFEIRGPKTSNRLQSYAFRPWPVLVRLIIPLECVTEAVPCLSLLRINMDPTGDHSEKLNVHYA